VLAYGSEAVLPVEVALHTHRLTTFQEELNNAALPEALDLPSIRGDALLREALFKLRITCLHNRTVRLQLIQVGNLVLRRMDVVARAGEHEKLTTNWDNPYKVAAQVRQGTYHLETINGSPIPRTWHSSNLKKYYTYAHALSLCLTDVYVLIPSNKIRHPRQPTLHSYATFVLIDYTFSPNGG